MEKHENQATTEHLSGAGDEALADRVIPGEADVRLGHFQERQRTLSVKDAMKESWKAVAWCGYMLFICVMFGYDSLAGSNVVSIAEFRKDFGYLYGDEYVVSADWQLGFQAATFGGLIIGGLSTGFLVQRFGRRNIIFAAYIINIGGVFLQYFCTTPAAFLGSKLLVGVPLGCFSTVAPTYSAEVAPLAVRGAVTAGMNLAIVLGNLLGYGVMREAGFYTGKATYRIMFAVQWGFIGVGILILPLLPESPYWLLSHGKPEQARHNIAKTHSATYDVDGHLADVQAALTEQALNNQGQGTIADCFKEKTWRRTLVAVSVFFIQNACGTAWVVGYMSYFMQIAGMSAARSFDITVGICGLMVVGNACGGFFIESVGRRGTALYGTSALFVTLLLIGILAVVDSQGALVAQVVLMGMWAFLYQGTIGSAAWPISAENASSWLRTPTQSLCTIVNAVSASIWGLSLPYMVNPDRSNLQGKVAFIFAAVLALSTIFIYFFIPETKGKSYEVIDELWSRGVSPRNFGEEGAVPAAQEIKLEAV
ncbi:general substrate transporter [Aspergillus germanicus]